ncbi:MAG: hypothetical protein RL375_4430 [Pseudomonadota bacterium]|jgi:hypothetical protein
MKYGQLDTAISEAQRFLKRAAAIKSQQRRVDPVQRLAAMDSYIDAGPRETGALRRASMDLTRALADLRRRGQ